MASHRKPKQRVLSGTTARTAATLAMAGAASATVLTETGHAAPRSTPDELRAQVADLYQQAEQATQKYDGAKAQADTTRQQLSGLQDELARRIQHMQQARDRLGSLAAARYRSGGLDPALQLMLSSRPDQYLERAGALDRAGSTQSATLRGLADQRRQAQTLRDQAAGKLASLSSETKQLAADKQAVETKLNQARDLLGQLTDGRQAAGQASGTASGRSDRGTARAPLSAADVAAPSARAAQAVAFAFAQLGKPYVWGATGPGSYDCSGLTQAAWQAAGVSLPRTTYTQIGAGQRVPQNQLQPGDLVFFNSSVSHVGIYVGNGQMIHAPHPGAPVRIAPVDEMPFAGATRPV